MCELVFEVQGKTENYVRLKKDGHGIKFLGNNFYLDYLYQKRQNYGTTYIHHRLYIVVNDNLLLIIGGRLLVEYEIQKEDLQIRSENGISRAVCKVLKY